MDLQSETHANASRRVLSYLTAPEVAEDYIAVMEVLEASVTDLTPAEVSAAVTGAGRPMNPLVAETRLSALVGWLAASARTDTTEIQRVADLLGRNRRYTATPAGRQVQRFYRDVLSGTVVLREIPLTSLSRAVTAAENLAARLSVEPTIDEDIVSLVGQLFTSHDDLDGALVGAEDALAALADRFDLDDDKTTELKRLLVDYATRVADDLDTGSARAFRALNELHQRFDDLAQAAVSTSKARALIEAGALSASRGGRTSDWEGLTAWFDPYSGRANRFSYRLVRSLPGMHANLRRLHTSSGTASSRNRLLALARAAAHPTLGTQIWQAALGDHSWRKLYGETDDNESGQNPSWRNGPTVGVPELLRATGRSGSRGRAGAGRDDRAARAEVAAARQVRIEQHDRAVREILDADIEAPLTEAACRVALASLTAAARATPNGSRRTAARDGLACTLTRTGGATTWALRAPSWRVLLPGRIAVFHLPGQVPNAKVLQALGLAVTASDDDERATLVVVHEHHDAPAASARGSTTGAAVQAETAEAERPGPDGVASASASAKQHRGVA